MLAISDRTTPPGGTTSWWGGGCRARTGEFTFPMGTEGYPPHFNVIQLATSKLTLGPPTLPEAPKFRDGAMVNGRLRGAGGHKGGSIGQFNATVTPADCFNFESYGNRGVSTAFQLNSAGYIETDTWTTNPPGSS